MWWRCGLAPNIGTLIAFRVLQGLVAGPMIPLSQTLLLASYPRAKAGTAMAMWGMTVLVAPVAGPLLGGWITDNISWPWIFYINIPVGLGAAALTWSIYRTRDPGPRRVPLDVVGLVLLVLFVGAMQIMIDMGKELDWFESGEIIALTVVSVVSFAFFLAWELTDKHPIVEVRLFARRNFVAGTVSLSIAYGLFFGNVVLLPLWLQQHMGYTATWAGLATAPVGLLAIVLSPWVGKNVGRIDPRKLATVAFVGFAVVLWMRSHFNTQADFMTILIPTVLQGAAMAFLVPTEPEAPGWFITTIFWPRCFSSSAAVTRETWSVEPPGAHGTISVIGRSGFHWAMALAVARVSREVMNRWRRGRAVFMRGLQGLIHRAVNSRNHTPARQAASHFSSSGHTLGSPRTCGTGVRCEPWAS